MAEKIQEKPELCGVLEAQRKKCFEEGTADSGFRSCSVSGDKTSSRPVLSPWLWGAMESSFSKLRGKTIMRGGEREQRQRAETILQGTHVCVRVRVSACARVHVCVCLCVCTCARMCDCT